MKRKRQNREAQRAKKRVKIDGGGLQRPTHALLQQYYSHVVTLRQYLAARTPKQRRRRLQQYGRDAHSRDDPAVSQILDHVLVGAFKHVEVEESSFIVDEDITLFTQQISEADPTLPLTPGKLKQSEALAHFTKPRQIVDFVIWLLFRRQAGHFRPQHVLCQHYQRYLKAHDEAPGPEIVQGIPGIYSTGPHENVNVLKDPPWDALPDLTGRGAERIIGDMLIECGLFVEVNGGSNFVQISGVPMSDLKVLPSRVADNSEVAACTCSPSKATPTKCPRSIGEIRFVRHRMLYARPALNAKGTIKYGLNQVHALNRFRDLEDQQQTRHIMRYVFPLQFGLHNVFASETDPSETAQRFKDYTTREQEISRQNRRRLGSALTAGRSHPETAPSLPRRLRGAAERLIDSMRRRQQKCSYSALLNFYCPQIQTMELASGDSLQQACSASQISAFCRAAVTNVFPTKFWGDGEIGFQNLRAIQSKVDRFVRLRRYESFGLHDVLQGLRLDQIAWTIPPKVQKSGRLSLSDFTKRKELMSELVYYLFDSFLIPLIRGHFHVTESNVNRNQLFYYRHDVWKELTDPALERLKQSMLEDCRAASINKTMSSRALGISHVRLLPKEVGMRPIINLRRRAQRSLHGKLVLGKSINSLLTPTFSILNHERSRRPEMLGSALFSIDDIFPRLQSYRTSLMEQGMLGQALYFAKIDVQACFDTIPQGRLLALAQKIVDRDEYQISKYSRAKLIGGHNSSTPGFGARPSWKFLTKATSGAELFDFGKEVNSDTAEGRTRSVYINGLAAKHERRESIMRLLKEHVEANLIKIGRKYYRQKKGIPQGSILSSLLCSYFYAELEREVLGFVNDGKSVLFRLIDDFLVISTERSIAERFVQVMHAGIPEFGVQVKVEKSRANFRIEIAGKAIPELGGADFPYCGTAINMSTLDISKDRERRQKTNMADSVTVEYSKLPGQTFYRKMLNALKLQMQAMLLSTSYNHIDTVLSNLYHIFTEVAQKAYHYVKSLPASKQPPVKLLNRAVEDLIRLACVLMRHGKRSSKDVMAYECSVKKSEARWLACMAFTVVFRRRQTKHRDVLAWLDQQLSLPALRLHERRLGQVMQRWSDAQWWSTGDGRG